MKKKHIVFGAIVILLILVIGIYSYKNITGNAIKVGQYDYFAKCLAENNATMYGTEWCPHCKSQKELFGDSFKYVNYVDCDKKSDICSSEGITGYPTWKIDGESYPGVQSLDKLSELTNCKYTNEETCPITGNSESTCANGD